jgi:hypothetical protein
MDYLKTISKFTIITLICGLILMLYGYLARWAGINFFWESKSIGFAILLIGLISLLANGLRASKGKNKKLLTILTKFGIGIIVFILVVRIILVIVIPNSAAYTVAKDYIINNSELINELGEIKGFGLIPTGGIQVSSDSNGEQGSASVNMIVKGRKKYVEVTVILNKSVDSDWKVEGIE